MNKLKIVTFGGGTGHVILLNAIKELYNVWLTALVTSTDSGGSSGRLRDAYGVFPPGDLRNCITALITDPTLQDMMSHRFGSPEPTNGKSGKIEKNDASLEGHTFGNLLITTANQVRKGDIIGALNWLFDFCRIDSRFRVLPITLHPNTNISALYANDALLVGEAKIDRHSESYPLPIKQLSLVPQEATICQASAQAIQEADLIIFSPGSIFTSLAATLLPIGTRELIIASRAPKIYAVNVMTQKGESSGPGVDGNMVIFKASDFVEIVEQHIGCHLDVVICNDRKPNEALLNKYQEAQTHFVEPDITDIPGQCRVITGDLLSGPSERAGLIRHDPDKFRLLIVRALQALRLM